jgi:predicted nucleotide-binding protein (sugar kinase/HSP70/actin superfamily)
LIGEIELISDFRELKLQLTFKKKKKIGIVISIYSTNNHNSLKVPISSIKISIIILCSIETIRWLLWADEYNMWRRSQSALNNGVVGSRRKKAGCMT